MLDERDLQAIAKLIDTSLDMKLAPIKEDLEQVKADLDQVKEDSKQMKADLDQVKVDLEQLKEDHEVTRGALNRLLEWSDKVSDAVDFPLPRS